LQPTSSVRSASDAPWAIRGQSQQLRGAYTEAGRSVADEKIEAIQELYWTARDELEMAHEETAKNTVYAADDRAAALDALHKVRAAYQSAVRDGPPAVGDEVERRIGHRLRELEGAVRQMEELAMEH